MADETLSNNKILNILNQLSEKLISQSPEQFIQTLPDKVCELLSVPVCIIWIKDNQKKVFKVLSSAGDIDDDYKKTELDINHPGVKFPSSRKVFHISDITKTHYRLADKELLIERKYKSLLSSPLKSEQEIIGIIDVFTKNVTNFPSWKKKLFLSIANYTTLSLQKTKLYRENKDKNYKLDNLKKKLRKLTEIMLEITNASEIDTLFKLLVEGASKLVAPAKIR